MASKPSFDPLHLAFGSDVHTEVLRTIRSPGWAHVQHYLKARRQEQSHLLIYIYKSHSHPDEMARAQAIVKFIDELLASTDETKLKLAGDVSDSMQKPTTNLHRDL